MKMNAEMKKELLLDTFELLKDKFEGNEYALRDIVVRMFELDKETAIDMWKYLLRVYEGKVKTDSIEIVNAILGGGSTLLGEEAMTNIVLNDSLIKKSVFSWATNVSVLSCLIFKLGGSRNLRLYYAGAGNIIQDKIKKNDLQVANELLDLVYHNKNKDRSWYEIIDDIMPEGSISDDAYNLLKQWCDKVVSDTEKAKLNLELLKYMD